MNYVDAGYAIALASLFLYAINLVVRRRRWERALRMSQASPPSPLQPSPSQPSPSQPSPSRPLAQGSAGPADEVRADGPS